MSEMLFAALHDLDPAFRSFSRSEKVAHLIHNLGLQQLLPVQSMYIFKIRRLCRTAPTTTQLCSAMSVITSECGGTADHVQC